jgi:hypothetical protein
MALLRGIGEILLEASKQKNRLEIVEYLRNNANAGLLTLLRYAYDTSLEWLLPPGAPPYKPNKVVDCENILCLEMRRLYIFMRGPYNNPAPAKMEAIFIEMLEAMAPLDAELLICVKDRKLPYKNITKAVVDQAFPGLLTDMPTKE